MWPFKKAKNELGTEEGYVLCGRVFGPKGFRFVEYCLSKKELPKFLSQLAKEVGITPLEVLHQLSVDTAIRMDGVVRDSLR